MARINVTQNINLQFDSVTMIPLVRGVNDLEAILANMPRVKLSPLEVLKHPYLQAHMKNGSASIVPDPLDPEDIALAAENLAAKRRAEAEAWKQVQKDKEASDAQKVAAIAAAPAAQGEANVAPLPIDPVPPQASMPAPVASEPQPSSADPQAAPLPADPAPQAAPVPVAPVVPATEPAVAPVAPVVDAAAAPAAQ